VSVEVMAWVWRHGPKEPTDRLVLLAVADHADEAGHAYPSMAGIAEKACLSERGARKIVRRLEAQGWLRVEVGGGRGGKSRYWVQMAIKGEQETGNEKPGMRNPEHESTKPGTRVHETRNHRSPEPSRNHQGTIKVSRAADGFDDFWAVYPRKVAKGAAVRAYANARKSADAATILAGAERYRDDPRRDPAFTAHPATWLNAERWADEPAAPPSPQPMHAARVRWQKIAAGA
jgi:hypothetical protein